MILFLLQKINICPSMINEGKRLLRGAKAFKNQSFSST